MKRALYRAPAALLTAGLAVATFAAVASPAAAAPAQAGVATHVAAATDAQSRAAISYWTPDRMRSATPLDALTVSASALRSVPAGTPTTVQPRAITPQSFPNGGAAWTSGGKVVSTAGRVFFTFQGQNASCSGDAVTSANGSTVVTAGHCVKLEGAFHTNWIFVPAYNNGNAPFGRWSARLLKTTPQWLASEDINYDVGTAVVNLNGTGQRLTDVVGSQGIAFNQPRGQRMYAFGYPAAAPYDGTRLIYCSGTVFNAFLSNGIGMTCNMTGGASGGPWFLGFSEATGTGIQNSVNSYKINLIPTWMFGPYFGTDAQNLYNASQNA
jgi:V8-like Glu-specific endopeptidase